MKSNIVLFLILVISLVGCNKSSSDSFRLERAEKFYAEAQADYVAGRLEAAAEGFAKVLKSNPGNASARFQLAVIMQDSLKDYLGALCNYREYIAIAGESDKVEIAKSRMDACEKDLLSHMAQKYKLGDNTKVLKELEIARADLAAAEKNLSDKAAALLAADKRIATLEREKQSLSAIVKRMGEDIEDVPERPRSPSVIKSEEMDSSRTANVARAQTRVIKEEEDESEKQLTVNAEAMALMQEEEREARSSSAMLPARPPKKEVKKVATTEPFLRQQTKKVIPTETTQIVRPDYYVVMPGDTLRKIAIKFYGDAKAWEKIREANKVRVPLSGDIRVGDKLRLP